MARTINAAATNAANAMLTITPCYVDPGPVLSWGITSLEIIY
jgi:hypothetical protein